MIDIVQVKDEIMAKKLGYSNIEAAAITDLDKTSKIPRADLVIARGGDPRALMERKKVDAIVGLESTGKKDFIHHRNSGLNHILCKIAAKNNIIICFGLPDILANKGHIFGRIRQNIRLCRKYKVKMGFASFASSGLEMRNAKDIIALLEVLGMHPKEAKEALEVFWERICLNRKMRSPEFICEGITKE